MSFHNHDTDDYNKKHNPSGRKEEPGMIQKHLDRIKELGFYYELVNLLDLQKEECLKSLMGTDFYRQHKNDLPKSYITGASYPSELEQWKEFKPAPASSPSIPILGAEAILDEEHINDDYIGESRVSRKAALSAMQTHSAQYREECERLREENEELKTFIKTNLQ